MVEPSRVWVAETVSRLGQFIRLADSSDRDLRSIS